MIRRCLVPFFLCLTLAASCSSPPKASAVANSAKPHVEPPPPEPPRAKPKQDNDIVVPPGSTGKYDPVLDDLGRPEQSSQQDQKPNTEEYKLYAINPFVNPKVDPLSTFSIDVDTGSYTIMRRKLSDGVLPPPASVRVEEYVNYFRYDYPDPQNGPFAVHLEGAPSPFVAGPNHYLVRIGVQGKRVDRKTRKPVHLVFLVDVSGSMASPDKLGLAKRALKILTNNLGPRDTVALATYAGRVAEILKPTGMEDRGRILAAIDSLESGGSTAMNGGLELAYRLASENYQPNYVNRIIVLTDGDANVGPATHEQILKRIEYFVQRGITLSTIGFGMGNYKDTMLEQLADHGNGNYYYVDTEKEARRIFGDQLDGTLQVIAKDVKIQVDFNPEAVKRYRLIGYENRGIADQDFRDDSVDAGEIGAGHTVTAMYDVELAKDPPQKIATVRMRYKKPEGDTATETAFRFNRTDLDRSIAAATPDFQFAAAVTEYAEILRHSPYAKGLGLDLVKEVAAPAVRDDQLDRKEFLGLVDQAQKLQAKAGPAKTELTRRDR